MHITLIIASVIITSAIQGVTIPILSTRYQSPYFLLIAIGLQLCFVYGAVLSVLLKGTPTDRLRFYTRLKIPVPREPKNIIYVALFSYFEGICLLYSSHPERTPVFIQVILIGSCIIPNVIMGRFFLNKQCRYDWRFIAPSLLLLAASIVLIIYPVFESGSKNSFWIIMFAGGCICLSGFNLMQERAMLVTKDHSLINKLIILFYAGCIRLVLIVLSFWLEFLIGYHTEPMEPFISSFKLFIGPRFGEFLLLELFIAAYLMTCFMAISLNSISSNYNMLLSTAVMPLVSAFFILFPKLNPGMKYSIWIVALCLVLNCGCIFLWIKGERQVKTDPGEEQINKQPLVQN